MNLPELEGDERRGQDGGEIFRPALAKSQARALGQRESRIKESADAEFFEFAVIHIGETGEKVMDEEVAGVDAESIDPMEYVGGNILMQETERPHSNSEQNQALCKFEGGNKQKAARTLGA